MKTEGAKGTASDGATEVHTLVGVGLVVSAAAFNRVVADRDALKAENERLLAANLDCMLHYEDARAELERIKALPPVAWEVYVADADNAYVVESLDDPQLIDDCTNNDAVVTPLIALGSKT